MRLRVFSLICLVSTSAGYIGYIDNIESIRCLCVAVCRLGRSTIRRPMVLSTLVEGWLTASPPRKCPHGHRTCCRSARPQARVDMYPWAGLDPSLPSPGPVQRSVQHSHVVDGEGPRPRHSAAGGHEAAGDFAGDGPQVARSHRFSVNSASLEQVPEEVGVGICQDAFTPMTPGTCSVRRAR